jgi:two-component system, cell cycle sensor histidine kinase PleC
MSEKGSLQDAADNDRILTAQLGRVFDSLPAIFYYNVPGIVVFGVILVLAGPQLGSVSWTQVAVATAVQSVGAVSAFVLYRHRRQELANLLQAERRLLFLQLVVGLCWGLVGWIYWRNGCPANNAAIAMGLFVNTWSTTFCRSAHRKMLFVGILVPAAVIAVRFASAPGFIAGAMLVCEPFWIVYILYVGLGSYRHVCAFFHVNFINEDMSAQLRKARDLALEEKMAAEAANTAKSKFIAGMSHELRTPLNAILGFSEIIAGQALGSSSKQYASYAQDIHDAGSHLLSLINDLLDVAKIEAGRMEIDPRPLDLAYALEGVERIIRDRAEAKHQQLAFAIDRATPSLVADERAFKQIVLNLVSNAVKYTQDGGHITVRCCKGADDGVQLCVADDGPGIAADKLEKIFQPFSQADNRYNRQSGGTGLGLSLVRGLVGLHKGRVWVESVVGQGTRMFVLFPARINENILGGVRPYQIGISCGKKPQ